MNEDKNKKLMEIIGRGAATIIIACLLACVVAISAKFIWWILYL